MQHEEVEIAKAAPALQPSIESKSNREVARLLGQSHVKRRKLRKAKVGFERWTEEEIAFLGKKKDKEVAALLGRKLSSVRSKREELHIPAFDPEFRSWKPKEDALLGTECDEKVAERLGRPRKGVQLRRFKLGIPAIQERESAWLPEEEAPLGTLPDEKLARKLGRELYGAPERLERVAKFVVEHWEQRRSAMEGKAMLVTMGRDIAARLYDEIRKLRPAWHEDDDAKGAMKVIMTGAPDDPEHMALHTRSKAQRKALADRFKDPADDFRLAIVVDMWLTGFDVPAAHTMYLDKPLAGHNLMQAIARVNRVYSEKPGGLIVDLIGLADPLADALATYANATGATDKPVKELQDEAIPAMLSAFEQLKGFFHGFDYAAALEAKPADMLRIYLGAIDHVLDVKHTVAEETGWQRFRGMVKRLATAFALAVPREETREIAPHLVFFQRVAAMIRKRLADDQGSQPGSGGSRDIDAAVRQVIGGAVDAGEVIDLFAAAGLDAARLDILSDEFLQRVSALEQKNLALETLRKLLNDQIKISERTNLVQAQGFREALEKAMLGYTNKQITTAQMIATLLDMARWVRDMKNRGHDLGLTTEEAAFYDALSENGSAKEVMRSDQLRLMARELAEMVKKLPKLDWTQRESVRADLRRKVRRLLALYGYPPDLSEDATALVLKQAELSTEYSE